jgi:hypothetical protein
MLNKAVLDGAGHKTVIILDHGPKFAAPAGEDIPIQIKESNVNHLVGVVPKAMWDCATESVMEFHRVVTDLFPSGTKQLRFVVSDFVGRFLNSSWTEELIPYEKLLDALSTCDVPNVSADAASCSILNGLSLAVEAISQQTTMQKNAPALYEESAHKTVHNTTEWFYETDFTKKHPQLAGSYEKWRNVAVLSSTMGNNGNNVLTAEEDGEICDPTASTSGHRRPIPLKNCGSIVVITSIEKFPILLNWLLPYWFTVNRSSV